MILPHLLLQKSCHTSKAKDHSELLGRRLYVWKQGDIDCLMREGRVLQRSLDTNHRQNDDRTASRFSRLMLAGKTKAALRLLSDEGGSTLQVHQRIDPENTDSKTVLQILKEKHPPAGVIEEDALLPESHRVMESHPVIFNNITSETIH